MAISTTLGALVQAEQALAAIGALKLSPKHAYHLKKLRTLVASETQHFQEQRGQYIKELGTPREDGAYEVKPDSPHIAEFFARLNELVTIPVELPIAPITLDMLGDEKVSAQDLMQLGPLLAESDDGQ